MFSLVAFATGWGTKFGGINSFNADFLEAFGRSFYPAVQVVCVVGEATPAEIDAAQTAHVTLLPMRYKPQPGVFEAGLGDSAIELLASRGIAIDPQTTVWLGHDRFTGAAAVAAARATGGRSALIHHMSYRAYESFAESSDSAWDKEKAQKQLFEQADIVFGVGPLLRDAAQAFCAGDKPPFMLVPGLADIEPRQPAPEFTAFLSGRLSGDAAPIKQGHLGVAAFAHAVRQAHADSGLPRALREDPRLILRGVDLEGAAEGRSAGRTGHPENELKRFAEGYAGRVINLWALPYTHDRQAIFDDLRSAWVALMPSWHEGFGLVGWEAIAAGVPLIVAKNSGLFRLLEESFPGSGTGCVYPVSVRGAVGEPYFHDQDLNEVAGYLKEIAQDPEAARRKARALRDMLKDFTWAACADEARRGLGWQIDPWPVAGLEETAKEQLNQYLKHYRISDEKECLRFVAHGLKNEIDRGVPLDSVKRRAPALIRAFITSYHVDHLATISIGAHDLRAQLLPDTFWDHPRAFEVFPEATCFVEAPVMDVKYRERVVKVGIERDLTKELESAISPPVGTSEGNDAASAFLDELRRYGRIDLHGNNSIYRVSSMPVVYKERGGAERLCLEVESSSYCVSRFAEEHQKLPEERPIAKSLFTYHRLNGLSVCVLYVFLRNDKWYTLVQKRSNKTRTYRGYWDTSASGYVEPSRTRPREASL
ncbi:MAG: glycosyltransferase [Betaproteobacteria bacterium]|nr:glycosyltransferase [Betaproteobacteria bacterium]